ncbi:MAG: hypothetical protein HW387_121 [Parachlamydiales bacterium]|nr:hypothetical protein [Parachlamydiales bacterium]
MSNPLQKTNVLQPKTLKWGLAICTTIYVVAFPVLLGMAFVCSMLALERPTETPFTIGVIVLALSSPPLSVPVSIYLMWSRYFRNQPNKALIFAGLPFYAFAAMFLICGILDAFTRR